MRIAKLAIAGSVIGMLFVGTALAAQTATLDPSQPVSIQQLAFEYDNYLYFADEEPSESPSDAAEEAAEEESAATDCDVSCDTCCSDSYRYGVSCDSCCNSCCQPVWTIRINAVFMNRAAPDSRVLVSEEGTGNTLLNADDLTFGGSTGIDSSFIYHRDSCRAIEFRYLWLGEQNSQTGYTLGGPTNIFVHTSPATSFGANTSGTATLSSELHSFELNALKSHCDWTFSYGVRYVCLDEESLEVQLPFPGGGENGTWRTTNDILGLQVGAERHITFGRLDVGLLGRAGIFWNDAETSFALDRLGQGDSVDVDAAADADLTALVAEVSLSGSYPVTCNLDLRFGYQVMWAEGVALATDQVGATGSFNVGNGTTIASTVDSGGTFYHGAFVGFEYMR